MAEQKKGHNFAIQGSTDKKKSMFLLIFCADALYITFQVPSSSGSLVLQPTKGGNGQTDGRMDGPAQTNMPPQLHRNWGHKNHLIMKYGYDRQIICCQLLCQTAVKCAI